MKTSGGTCVKLPRSLPDENDLPIPLRWITWMEGSDDAWLIRWVS
jgi:hypothetical protein